MVSFYEDFLKRVADGRKKSRDEVDAVAQGRVWTGTEALRHGLVDRLGGLDVALALAKEKARIGKDEEVQVVVLPERKGLLETILERQEEGMGDVALPRDVKALARLSRVFGDGGLLARLPFDLRVR
jgi:protease-4